jgi:hypothetical protein
MREEQLITGESFLLHSDNGLITLTTHRIRYHNKVWGASNLISIMLEKISTVQVLYISYPGLWVGGLLVILLGAVFSVGDGNVGVIAIAVIIGLVLIAAYFGTRRHICVIASDGGGKIVFRTEVMSTATLMVMVDKVELAKHNRLMELRGLVGSAF